MTVGLAFGLAMEIGLAYAAKWAGKSMYQRRANCSKIEKGKYLGKKLERRLGPTSGYVLKPEFEVEINGKPERICAMDGMSRRKWKQFQEGQIYTIYVNPDKPEDCRCTTKVIYMEEIIWWIYGGIMFYGSIIICVVSLLGLI